MASLPLEKHKNGVRLRLRLTPKAARNAITGTMTDAAGVNHLKVTVTAVPEKGKANAALIRFLAKEWKLPKSAFDIVSGETDRNKVLCLDVPYTQIAGLLAPLCKD